MADGRRGVSRRALASLAVSGALLAPAAPVVHAQQAQDVQQVQLVAQDPAEAPAGTEQTLPSPDSLHGIELPGVSVMENLPPLPVTGSAASVVPVQDGDQTTPTLAIGVGLALLVLLGGGIGLATALRARGRTELPEVDLAVG